MFPRPIAGEYVPAVKIRGSSSRPRGGNSPSYRSILWNRGLSQSSAFLSIARFFPSIRGLNFKNPRARRIVWSGRAFFESRPTRFRWNSRSRRMRTSPKKIRASSSGCYRTSKFHHRPRERKERDEETNRTFFSNLSPRDHRATGILTRTLSSGSRSTRSPSDIFGGSKKPGCGTRCRRMILFVRNMRGCSGTSQLFPIQFA